MTAVNQTPTNAPRPAGTHVHDAVIVGAGFGGMGAAIALCERGRRDLVQKTPLWSADVADGLATLREQGKAEFFGQPAAALINLMKLCEGRLLPAPAKGGAPS